MKQFRGEIYNGKGKTIFSRRINAENEEDCIDFLKKHVLMSNVPTPEDFVHSMMYGGGFEDSPHNLNRYFDDVSELTFDCSFVKNLI